MARKADKNTTRQKAFALLDEHPDASRADMLEKIMVDFDVGLPYAKTLYQHWRKKSKEAGTLTKVFVIRDHKDGQTVDPYVFTKHIAKPIPNGMATTEAKAVKQYIRELQKRTEKAQKL